ncbi:MAG: hypothetical protein RDU20_22130 [Desulfomonilaceae bacterium]|nr:hypothetical protein [Desulfomonilaceae bacterium]
MKTPVMLIIVAAILTPVTAPCEKRDFCRGLEEFVDTIFKTANFDNDPTSREKKYTSAVNELTSAAGRHFGPVWDSGRFTEDVMAFVRHQELYRRPPPGWEPKSSMENMILFSGIARDGLQIDLKLLNWCNTPPASK